MLTEGSEVTLQKVFTGLLKEKCRLAGAGSLGAKEKAFGGPPGPALSLATGLALVPASHDLVLAQGDPEALPSLSCAQLPWGPDTVDGCFQGSTAPFKQWSPRPAPPHPKDAGKEAPWPSEGSAEPLGHQPGTAPVGQGVGAGMDPSPGNEQGGQDSSTVNQGCKSRD